MAADKAEKQQKQQKQGKRKKGSSPEDAGIKIAEKDGLKITGEGGEARLYTLYKKEIAAKLKNEFGFKNAMEVPRLEKITLNCAMKEAVGNPKVLDGAINDLMLITGQRPVLTRAKKSIATFKLRQGVPLAARVTLRHARMYEFLDRLVNVCLPRVRDFKGVSPKSFDGRGNYSLGLKEQIIFPEINYDKVDQIRGMSITITTSAKKNEHARSLLAAFGMPFRN